MASSIWGEPIWGVPPWGAGGSGSGGAVGGGSGPPIVTVGGVRIGGSYPSGIPGLTFTRLKTPEFRTLVQRSPDGFTTRMPQVRNPIWHFQLLYEYVYGNYRSLNNQMPYAPATDISTFMGFFCGMYGSYASFLWDDPKDRTARGVIGAPWKPSFPYALNDVAIDPSGHAQLATIAGQSDIAEPVWDDLGGTTADGGVTWTDQGYWPDGFGGSPVTLQLLNDGSGSYFSPIQRDFGGRFLEDVTDLNGSITVYESGVLSDPSTYAVQGPGLGIPGASAMGLYLAWLITPTPPITATFNFLFRMKLESDQLDFERFMDELWTIGGGSSKNGSGSLRMCSTRPALNAAQRAAIPAN